jgi:hypothetical protein
MPLGLYPQTTREKEEGAWVIDQRTANFIVIGQSNYFLEAKYVIYKIPLYKEIHV